MARPAKSKAKGNTASLEELATRQHEMAAAMLEKLAPPLPTAAGRAPQPQRPTKARAAGSTASLEELAMQQSDHAAAMLERLAPELPVAAAPLPRQPQPMQAIGASSGYAVPAPATRRVAQAPPVLPPTPAERRAPQRSEDAEWADSCWPSCEFRVLPRGGAPVHAYPSSQSGLRCHKAAGSVISASEETFDGWIRVAGVEDGWMQRQVDAEVVLQPVDAAGVTPVVETDSTSAATTEPGLRVFEVVLPSGLSVHEQPTELARTVGFKAAGEALHAATQTFHGWLRLATAEGWVRGRSKEHGVTVRLLPEATQRVRVERLRQRHDRAVAEAAVERSIEQDRASRWWERLEAPQLEPELRPCGRLALHQPPPAEGAATEAQNPLDLPVRAFRVLPGHDAGIRAEPLAAAPVIGMKRAGEEVLSIEETFDGWAKLAAERGWVLRASRSWQDGHVDVHLEPVDATTLVQMAADELSDESGEHIFEVAALVGVDVFPEPWPEMEATGFRGCGQRLVVETQTYHGWVRLADGAGWAPSTSPEDGELLRPVFLQEQAARRASRAAKLANGGSQGDEERNAEVRRQEALQQVLAAKLLGDRSAMRAAVELAKRCGVPRHNIERATADG